MKLIKPSFEILEQKPKIVTDTKQELINIIYRQIERAGRTCYRSEDKITEDSAKEFVERMVKSKHYAMLEHGTVYLSIPYGKIYDSSGNNWILGSYIDNPYSYIYGDGENYYITTNYRVLIENDILNDLEFICEPSELHEKRITVHFICDKSTSHEFVRHRVFSFAQESTRRTAMAA